jgi:hypothetical protein
MDMHEALNRVLAVYAGRLGEISKPAIRRVLGMDDNAILMNAEDEIIVSYVSTASYRIYCENV